MLEAKLCILNCDFSNLLVWSIFLVWLHFVYLFVVAPPELLLYSSLLLYTHRWASPVEIFLSILILVLIVGSGTYEGKDDWNEDKGVSHACEHDSKPQPEEHYEVVWVGWSSDNYERQESWDVPVEDAWADPAHSYTGLEHSLPLDRERFGRFNQEVSVWYVDRVEDWKAKARQEVHHREVIEG